MKPKHIPMRTCVGCGVNKAKKDLIRVVRTPESKIELDFIGKKSGRGAYICPDSECLTKAIKAKQLERALKTKIDDEIKSLLEAEIHG